MAVLSYCRVRLTALRFGHKLQTGRHRSISDDKSILVSLSPSLKLRLHQSWSNCGRRVRGVPNLGLKAGNRDRNFL